MALVNLTNLSITDALIGEPVITVQNSTQLTIRFPLSGATVSFNGNFVLASGEIIGGVLTSINYSLNGSTALSISQLNLPLTQVVSALSQSDAAFANLIYGGADEVFGSVSGEVLTSHGGNDTIIALDGNDTVYGGAGDDDVNGNVGQDVVHGDDGRDFVRGGRDNDTIYGDAGDDVHVNGNIGNDLVFGGIGNDTVYGGQDQDTLHGESGNDDLSGDLGNDILYGEAGADRFILRTNGGVDWVADFSAVAGDRIMLTPGTSYTVLSQDNQVMIAINGGADRIGLAGVASSSFSADWIVFG